MKILFLLLMLAAAQAFGAMTLIKREMFVGTGQITSNAPDQFDVVSGTLNCRYVGPSVLPATNGYSMDNMTTTAIGYGQFTLSNTATNYILWAAVFVKTGPVNYKRLISMGALVYADQFDWGVTNGGLLCAYQSGAIPMVTFPQFAGPQWVWIGVGLSNKSTSASSQLWDVRYYVGANGVLTNCYTVIGASGYQRQQMNQAKVWMDGVLNQTWNGRIGAVSLYSFKAWTDITLPTDVVLPTSPNSWYVNPATGNDTNTGAYPNQAWKTANKIDEASANCGLFPATNYANGDTLFIDTSAGPLDLTQTNLVFSTQGLNVMATNATYWTNLIASTLTNSSFTLIGSNTYAYSMGSHQPNIVVWEDEKWMNHPQGATYLVVSNSLATNAGSFWTDGTNAYVHPFSDSSPLSDGKVYTRSSSPYTAAIALNASDMNFRDCYAGKTALINPVDNNDGVFGYVIGTENGFGGNSVIDHCYLYYGSKHILGLVASSSDATVTVQDVQCEQAGAPTVSATAWVLFMDGVHGESNNVYSFIRCRTDKTTGQIGSTSGILGGNAMTMHNSSSGVQFKSVTFDSCQLNGNVGLAICSNAIVTNCVFCNVQTQATVSNIIVNSKFTGRGVDLLGSGAHHTIVQNCLNIDTNSLTPGQWPRNLQGNDVVFQNNTFDFSGVYSSADNVGQFVRSGSLTNFIFRNNIVIIAGTNQFAAFQNFNSANSCSFSNNLYVLGSSNHLAAAYTNGASGTNLTFTQWQALGFDANSVVVTNPLLNTNYSPVSGSPTIGTGANLSAYFTTDYAGNPRPATGNWTIGAYQVASSTGGAGIITIFFLPAATGAGGTLKLAWLADYLGWILQSQTNSLNTGLSTNWVDVPGSSAITQTNITIDSAKPLMFFRLRSP